MKRYISILIVFALFLISCKETETNSEEKTQDNNLIKLTEEQFERTNLELEKPEMITFSEEFEVTGMIDVPPKNRASVTSYFDGYVTKTDLLVGDRVKKGEVLVKLKHPDFIKFQQNYVEALSNLEYLSSEFQRKQNLFDDQIIAQKVFQSTKNDYLQANAQLKAAKEQLLLMNLKPEQIENGSFTSEISILAPISGKISKLNVSQGKFVAKSDMIMEILDVEHVHLELNVFEKDLLKISEGDSLSFEIPEQSNARFKAYVRLIGAEINENRSVRIHAHPIHEDETFAVGMFVNAYFKTDSKEHLALPETAFTEVDDKTYILQLAQKTDGNYRFSKIEVETTAPQNGFKPILNSDQIDVEAKFLTKGVFDIVTSGSDGED